MRTVRVDVLFTGGRFQTYSVITDYIGVSSASYDPIDYVRRMLFSLGIYDATVMQGS